MTSDIRTRALAEWRGYRERPEKEDRTQAVASALEKVMRQLGLDDRLTESQILNAWQEIVGDWFALHTCPERLREGVLLVRVVQSSVLYELDRNCKKEILQKLKARFGARRVRDVKFRIG